MIDIRVFYTKKEEAKYISHLDMNRCMQRALKRSALPVWYSEGFNPHMYITFALPLSLGFESNYEIMDFRLTEEMELEKVQIRLNTVLPPGIHVFKVAFPEQKPKEITWADFSLSIAASSAEFIPAFSEFCGQKQILTIKKTKKGEKEINLRPFISLLNIQGEDASINLSLRLAAGLENNINPTLLLKAFSDAKTDVLFTCAGVRREILYNRENQIFV